MAHRMCQKSIENKGISQGNIGFWTQKREQQQYTIYHFKAYTCILTNINLVITFK